MHKHEMFYTTWWFIILKNMENFKRTVVENYVFNVSEYNFLNYTFILSP